MDTEKALNIIKAIASGDDPYATDEFSEDRPENNPDTIKALCVTLTNMLDGNDNLNSLPIENTKSIKVGSTRNKPLDEYIQEIEKKAIEEALEEARYNKTKAAQLLGISFRALRYKLQALNMEDKDK